MKSRLTGTRKGLCVAKPGGADAALSLQEELVAAIHGAFEVAVELAVQQVTKLVGQATGDAYEEMRQENESLKQRLHRAEALLDCARRDERNGFSPPPAKHIVNTTDHSDRLPLLKYNQKNPISKVGNGDGCTGVTGDTAPARHSRAGQPCDPKHAYNEQKTSDDVKTQYISAAAASDPEENNGCAVANDALNSEDGEETSRVCAVGLENINQPDGDLPLLSSGDHRTSLDQVTVKQEREEEEEDGSACCLDSIKVEDLSPECMLAVQSKMLEEWKPEVLDIQSQDSTTLSCSGLAQAHPSNLTTNVPQRTDLPSHSSEFPNIFQLAETAPIIPEAPLHVYGVHVRTNIGHLTLYTCKSCGQTFHLPSLLRRHYGQCQQKLQQSCQEPVAASRKTRLQLYPPGCSPFRCMECNREFNRMENLKTHLRIHTGERPYVCSVCSKCFRHSGALTRHFRIHTGEKPYICGQCGKSFRNCGGLKFHQRSHSKQFQ